MQTFLPYPNFRLSAKCLDNKRLGKQRVEAWQIYNVIKKIEKREKLESMNAYSEIKRLGLDKIGWEHHPAIKMWKNDKKVLLFYGENICKEWINRGFKDTLLEKFLSEEIKLIPPEDVAIELPLPSWFGDVMFHTSHKSNLLRKNPSWYSKFNWKYIPNDLEYVWPVGKLHDND